MPSVGEKRFHCYPLSVIRDQWALCTGSQKPDGREGEHLLGIRTSIPLFTNHQLLITSSLCDNLCLLWEKSGFIVTRYPLPVIRDQCVLCTGSQKPDGRMRGAPSGHPYSHSSSSPITNHQSPITNHLFPPRQSVPSVGEKLFHRYPLPVTRYPLSVTSGCFTPQVKSLMAG